MILVTALNIDFSQLSLLCAAWFSRCSCNCKVEMSIAPTKVKSWETAYSQALHQNRIDSKGSEWCLELRWGGRYGKRMNY